MMTIEERLALDRQYLALDPLNVNTFINYDRWAPKIKEICEQYVAGINIHYTRTSKCQTFSTTLKNDDYIIIDENHIYMMCRYASIVFQIAYAEQHLSGKKKEELIQNAMHQLDVMYIRYEATFFIYSDNTSLFFLNALEFLSAQEGIENKASENIDFDRIFCGPNSQEMRNHLDIVNEMIYMMIVLHEICHCAFKNNSTFLEKYTNHISQFLIDRINRLDPEIDDKMIHIFKEVLKSKRSLEEIACDHFALTHLIEIFGEVYSDKKLIMTLFNSVFAIMDYNQKILNVMREMNSLLALFDVQSDTKEEYLKMMAKPIMDSQYEYIARQDAINELKFAIDLTIFPTKEAYIPELDDAVRKYNSAAGTLFEYASDFTSMDYLNNFFQTISYLENTERDPSMRESFISLFQWDLSLFSYDDNVKVDKVIYFDKLTFEAYVHCICWILDSYDGEGLIFSKENFYTKLIPDIFFFKENKCIANVPVYTDGNLTDVIIDDIKELALICFTNKLPAYLRVYINCFVEENIKEKLLKDFGVEIFDFPKIQSIAKTLDITKDRLEKAKSSIGVSKNKNLNDQFENIDDLKTNIKRYDSRMLIYGVDDSQTYYTVNAIEYNESPEGKFIYFIHSESIDNNHEVFELQTILDQNDFTDFNLIFIVENDNKTYNYYIPIGEISCDIENLEFRLHLDLME